MYFALILLLVMSPQLSICGRGFESSTCQHEAYPNLTSFESMIMLTSVTFDLVVQCSWINNEISRTPSKSQVA